MKTQASRSGAYCNPVDHSDRPPPPGTRPLAERAVVMQHEMHISQTEATTASKHASIHARLAVTAPATKWSTCANGFRVNYTPVSGPGGTS